MKKIFLGSLVSLLIMASCDLLNQCVLKSAIPDFLVGWFSCTGYYAVYLLPVRKK